MSPGNIGNVGNTSAEIKLHVLRNVETESRGVSKK